MNRVFRVLGITFALSIAIGCGAPAEPAKPTNPPSSVPTVGTQPVAPPPRITPDAPFRKDAPAPDGSVTFVPPKVEAFKLKNGIRVLFVERRELPIVSVRVVTKGGAGDYDKAEKMVTDNRVLFHRMANTLNYLDIKTVVVSCGTCYDQLAGYEFEKIFPGCRIMDIHEYLLEKNVKLEGVTGTRYMYHDPCHSPMKMQDPLKTVNALVSTIDNVKIEKNDRCCGESGTLAAARPDISTQVRFRKEQEMVAGADKLRQDFDGDVKILTSCPACLQGLTRYNDDSGTTADYIVVEMAKHKLGDNWLVDYVARANDGGIERVLV